MAQFDVHANPGQHRDSIPYVVVVQSAIFDGYKRRMVIPLVRKSHLGAIPHARFNPLFTIKGVSVVLHPLEMVSVPVDRLGAVITSLTEHGDHIMGAVDELLTRTYG